MGIDIYLKWDGMTEEDRGRQLTGFSTTVGGTGYLREAYHGGPYATQIFFREAFEAEECEAEIPAALMRERMDNVTEPARGCDGGHHVAQLFGKLLSVVAPDGIPKNKDESFNTDEFMRNITAKIGEQLSENGMPTTPTTEPMTGREAIYIRCLTVYPQDGKQYADDVLKSFEEFISLAERKERETGRPCTVVASY